MNLNHGLQTPANLIGPAMTSPSGTPPKPLGAAIEPPSRLKSVQDVPDDGPYLEYLIEHAIRGWFASDMLAELFGEILPYMQRYYPDLDQPAPGA